MKNKLVKGVISASVSLLSFGAIASNLSNQFDLVPYVGVDAQWRNMEFKRGYGKEQTKNNYPQGNIYLGLKLNQYVGLEVGYEQTTAIKKNTTVRGSDTAFGAIVDIGDPIITEQFNTKTRIRAFHANVVGFWPISEQYCLQLIGSLGIARTNVNTTFDTLAIGNLPLSANQIAQLHQVFSKKKWVPKIGIGLQHMLTCQLGVRAMASWEGTGRGTNTIRDIISLNAPKSVARTKDSMIFGLGLFYNFK